MCNDDGYEKLENNASHSSPPIKRGRKPKNQETKLNKGGNVEEASEKVEDDVEEKSEDENDSTEENGSYSKRELRSKKNVNYADILETYYSEEDKAIKRRKKSKKELDESACNKEGKRKPNDTYSLEGKRKPNQASGSIEENGSNLERQRRDKRQVNYTYDSLDAKAMKRNRKYTEEFCLMCHQCKRNDKGEVVRCLKCKSKHYCHPCLENWYPKMTHDEVAKACPVCLGNCNCKACLRDVPKQYLEKLKAWKVDDSKIVPYAKYMLKWILPFLKQLNEEQLMERKIEATLKGVSLDELEIPNLLQMPSYFF